MREPIRELPKTKSDALNRRNAMRSLFFSLPLLLLGGLGPVRAAEQTVPSVLAASAAYSPTKGHTIFVRAQVRLDNGCWSNPHFQVPDRNARPDAEGVLPITVVADSSEGPGMMCSMHVLSADVPPLRWTSYPNGGLRAVRVIGSREPVVAVISGSGGAGK